MGGDLLGVLEGAAVGQVGRDAGRAKRMTAGRGRQASGLAAALDDVEGLAPPELLARQAPGAIDALEEWRLRIDNPGALEVGIEVGLG
jgi:hypothetical protein